MATIASILTAEVDGDFARVTSNEPEAVVLVAGIPVEPNAGWVCVVDQAPAPDRLAGWVRLRRLT